MSVGGQAVLEGVMMRAPGMVATAVRRSDGTILVRGERFVSLAERFRTIRLPIVRGAVGLIEMLVVGIRALNLSAAVAMEDAGGSIPGNGSGHNGNGHRPKPPANGKVAVGLTVAFSLLAGVAIFFAGPLVIATSLFRIEQDPVLFNLSAGAIRVCLLLAYLAGISMLSEIRRLFQYHGAEHKAVFAFERGEELSTRAAMLQSRFHPRCGTSFLLVVVIGSIALFALVDSLLIHWLGGISLGIRLVTHLPLIPIVGGLSYEFLRFSAKRSETLIGRLIVAPGLWLQRITTREPDERQVEVALAALRAALNKETLPAGVPALGQSLSVN